MCGARQGDDLYMLKMGVNKALKTSALYKATPADAVKIPIRRSGPQRKTISFHRRSRPPDHSSPCLVHRQGELMLLTSA